MMLYTIFVVCVVGTKDCNKLYAEIPRPPGQTEAVISDAEMLMLCIEHNKEDHSFDNPVTNPKGQQVKIAPTDCVLGDKPPAGTQSANEFRGYH
jgi:hypothetical protein